MPVNLLTEVIKRGFSLIVLSPHLDDAVLSCGALMSYAVEHVPVTVVTLFTEAGPPPYTLSARRHLRHVGVTDAESLYYQRKIEDQAVLESIGVTWVHIGLTDALYRRNARSGRFWINLLPELAHIYPVYRRHIVSGNLAPADAGTLQDACTSIQRIACQGPALVLAPLAVGGHVDHLLTRTAAELSAARVGYYSDFPYNQRHLPDDTFIRRSGLVEARWSRLIDSKADLIREYRTQVHGLFKDGRIPIASEVFFVPDAIANAGGIRSK